MKKNYFLLLCSLLLSVSFFNTACSEDEVEPVVEAPSFPALVSKTAVAGEVIDITFDANYDWVASISESTYAYFQLLTGEGANATTTKSVSGVAGSHTIKVKVAEDVVYDNAPVAEVTLSMNGESQVIAKLTYPVSQRSVAIYAPKVNDWGAFQGGAYGGELLYAYEEEAMSADASIVMAWGVERGNTEGTDTFFAPVMIETNFDYTVAGPEWMVAAEAGVAGAQEHIIKADAEKLPAESAVETIDIMAAGSETIVASFNVEVTGYNDFILVEGFSAESAYTADGQPQGYAGVDGYITSADTYVAVVCDATGAEVDWVTIDVTSEDATIIKNYIVSATVAENTGATRTANLFFFSKNGVPADLAAMFNEDGSVKEEYAANFATAIVQYTAPATIDGTEVDSEAATFSAVGANFANSWFFDDLRLPIGSKYELHYWGEWATYAHEYTYFTASRPIAALTCYYYDDLGSLVEVSEDNKWVDARTFGVEEEKVKFRIYCEDFNAIPQSAKNWQNGDGEAVVLVEHTDGSYSAIYFHISGKSESGDAGVAFENEQYAGWAGASLVELKEGDELYDTYFAEYSSSAMPAKFYHLTYQAPIEESMYSMVRLTGIGSDLYANPACAWAYYNQMNQTIVMEAPGAGAETPGAVVFMNSMGINQIVILCTLVSDGQGEGGEGGEGDDDEPEVIDWDYVMGNYTYEAWNSPYHLTDMELYNGRGLGYYSNLTGVYKADELIDNNDNHMGTPVGGQKYAISYSYWNFICFDIDNKEIDPQTMQPKEGTGCYALINTIDRPSSIDKILENYSYYDKKEGAFYICFKLRGIYDMVDPNNGNYDLQDGKTDRMHCGKLHTRVDF